MNSFKDKIIGKMNALETRKQGMIGYIKLKLEEEDFHAVFDGAADARDIKTEIASLAEMVEQLNKISSRRGFETIENLTSILDLDPG